MKVESKRLVIMLVGSILILANAIWIASEGKAIVISSYPATSTSGLRGDWGRIVFGMPNMILGATVYLWLSLAIINLILVVLLYFKPRMHYYIGLLVLLLSLTSIPVGGGFIIGIILTIVWSAGAIQDKPIGDTFLGKILRAMKLDSTLYESTEKSENLRTSALIIVFLNILTGLGNGLYVLTANKILDPLHPDIGANILLKGDALFDPTVFGIIGNYIGIAILRWLILSAIMYFVLTRIVGTTVNFRTLANGVSLAYAPIALQAFLPLAFFNEPTLRGTWPLAFFFISNIWMAIALVYATRKIGNLSTGKALGITTLAGTIYYLINSTFIEPSFPTIGIRFAFQPIVVLELILSGGVLVALLLGAFSGHEH